MALLRGLIQRVNLPWQHDAKQPATAVGDVTACAADSLDSKAKNAIESEVTLDHWEVSTDRHKILPIIQKVAGNLTPAHVTPFGAWNLSGKAIVIIRR
jgi:hypothetical protein